jgi:hypothetical protein
MPVVDSFIQLPPDDAGKKIDADSLTVGSEGVYRERQRIAGIDAAELADVTNTDPATTEYGLITREINSVSPVVDALNSSALAAGSSANLDGTFISASATGKLVQVTVSSSVACKWIIKTLDGAAETTIAVLFTPAFNTFVWRTAEKDYNTLAYSDGDETFRVTAINLDQDNAGDVYTTIEWDEVS